MNYREVIIRDILAQLALLKIPDSQTETGDRSNMVYLTPNAGYRAALREVVIGPITESPEQEPAPIPVAYVSFSGGRNDGAVDTLLSHLVETLEIRIDILLDKNIGRRDGNEVLPITFQASDLLHDIQQLVNLTVLQGAVHGNDSEIIVQGARLEEWGYDDRYRGGDLEILNLIFQIAVANPQETL